MPGDRKPSANTAFFAALEKIAGRDGIFRRLGRDHAALFIKRGPVLFVTFESHEAMQDRGDVPVPVTLGSSSLSEASHLSLVTTGDSWFRAPEIYHFFDELTDAGFFDGYERVIFFGAGMGGYAAAAFSVAAPGATLLLVSPQATLDPGLAGWDPRFSDHRRLSFTDRYGYAPDMADAAHEVFVLFDPDQTFDAMHATLFARPHTHLLRLPHMGADLIEALEGMRILYPMLAAAAEGQLTPRKFRDLYRKRRGWLPYLRKLMNRLEADGRPLLGAHLAHYTGTRLNDPKYLEQARRLRGQLTAPLSQDATAD